MWRNFWLSAFCIGLLVPGYSQVASFPYSQGFEASLTTGENVWFLEHWWGNDVRSSNSRIHIRNTPVVSGSQAIAVVPTSSFNGEVLFWADFRALVHPQLSFFAASDKNGSTSTRPSLVQLDWSVDSGFSYSDPVSIGEESTFSNEDFSVYERFLVELPDSLTRVESVLIRWSVSRGDGSGSAARWLMDDVSLREAGPRLTSLSASDQNTLVATWDAELDSSSATTLANYTLSGDSLLGAVWSSDHPNQVILSTSNLANGTQYLTVNSITSAGGDLRTEPDSLAFSYLQLQVDSAVIYSDTAFWLQANQNLHLPSTEISLSAGTIDSISYANDSSSVWVYFTPAITPGDELTISYDGLQNSLGNSLFSGSASLTYQAQLRLVEGQVLDEQHLQLFFNYGLDSLSASSISNFSDVASGELVQAVDWNSSTPNQITLTLPYALVAGDFQMQLSNLASQEAAVDSLKSAVFSFSYLPLEVLEFQVQDSQNIWMIFNQPVPSLEADSAYLDGEMGLPLSTTVVADTLMLVWEEELVHNQYALTLRGLVNEEGNSELDTTIRFFFEASIPSRALIINELFADPNPKDLLPDSLIWPTESNREFVEIYNRTDRAYSLAGCQLSGGELDTVSIEPGGWVLLLPDTSEYSFTGTVVEISDWNSLSNGGEAVWLAGPVGNTIDSVFYDDSWYRDSQKDGGWSLERINPDRICSDENNWRASLDVTGATPNQANSVLDLSPDTLSPELIHLGSYLPDSIQLTFSEPVETDTTFLQWNADPTISFTGSWAGDQKNLWLYFPDSLVANQDYTLALDAVQDCEGNVLADTTIYFQWDTLAPELVEAFMADWNAVRLVWNESLGEAVDTSWFFVKSAAIQEVELLTNQEMVLRLDEAFSARSPLWVGWDGVKDVVGNPTNRDSVYLSFENAVDTAYGLSDFVTTVVFSQKIDSISGLDPENYWLQGKEFGPAEVVANGSLAVNLVWPEALSEDRVCSLQIQNLYDSTGFRLFTPTTSFVWDQEAPRIDLVSVENATQLRVYFDEPVDSGSAVFATRYTLDPDGIAPLSVELLDDNSARLHWEVPFVQEVAYTLKVRGVHDLWGNVSSQARTYDFVWDTTAPSLVVVAQLADTLLRLTFSEDLASLDSLWVDGGPSDSLWSNPYQEHIWYAVAPAVDHEVKGVLTDASGNSRVMDTLWFLPDANWVRAWFSSDTSLYLQSYPPDAGASLSVADFAFGTREISRYQATGEGGYLLGFKEPVDAGENEILSTQWPAFQELSLGHPVVLQAVEWMHPQLLALEYASDLSAFYPHTASEYLILPDSLSPESVVMTEQGEQWVFRDSLQENTEYTLVTPVRWDGWEVGLPSVRYTIYIDTEAPGIDSLWLVGRRQLQVRFSEPVDLDEGAISLAMDDHALVDLQQLEDRIFRLTFENAFAEADSIVLNVGYVEDSAGNFAADLQATVYVPSWATPEVGLLSFTEVMADPLPAVGLPENEYVELYNGSADSLWVEDWQLTDGRDTARLPGTWWSTESYLLITGTTASGQFGDSVFHLPVTRFPSLNNAGETLTLLDHRGQLLASLTYSDAWHTLEAAENGGVSLERAPGDNPCLGSELWASSLNQLGGTPGYANSLAEWSPDTTAPQLISAGLLSAEDVLLSFSEGLDTLTPPVIQFSGEYVVAQQRFNAAGDQITVSFMPGIDSGSVFSIQISGARDCIGQLMPDTLVSLVVGRAPQYLELVVTEIRPHPTDEVPLPPSEYLELFNASDDILELGGVHLEDATGTVMLPPATLAPQSYLILCPSAEVGRFSSYGQVLGLSGWRTLNKAGEPLRLYAANHQPLHQITYPADWFEDTWEGASWEMVDQSQPCRDGSNWAPNRSAEGGSPGRANLVSASQPDLLAPELSAGVLVD
ncbi:MAG TPA: hypothetical protein DCR93_16260, partial [Cytophagales bacterium]|nr:hypothetical protein [Cytophagales bacterium]